MTKLLRDMYLNLSDTLNEGAGGEKREQNYQKQLDFYRQIYEVDASKTERESLLVAARCLISISRCLCENEYSGEKIEFARGELLQIKDVFEKEEGSRREDIKRITQKRISALSNNSESELTDSFLFFYMSLLQL